MFEPKIAIDRDLYEQLERVAEGEGYASTREFIIHVLEQAVTGTEENDSEEKVRKRLQGLGYLD